jgi:hypothetical protein
MSSEPPTSPTSSGPDSSDQFADLAHNITDDEIKKLEEAFLLKAKTAHQNGESPDEFLNARWILHAYQKRRHEDTSNTGVQAGGAGSKLAADEQHHQHRLETLRHWVAITLVILLFLVVIGGLVMTGGLHADVITQAAAPIAGLAGIAVGWLFGTASRPTSG